MICKSTYALLFNSNVGSAALVAALDFVAVVCFITTDSTQLAMTGLPLEKDVVDGPAPIEILARVAAQQGEPDRAIAALQKLLSIPSEGAAPSRTREMKSPSNFARVSLMTAAASAIFLFAIP